MAEWKLFDDVLPEPPEMLATRGWMDLENQPGFPQRAAMVAGLVGLISALRPDMKTVTDLGCGDGAMMRRFPSTLQAQGYELGAADVAEARARGTDVRQANILSDPLEYGDLIVASEVLEHLENPEAFLCALPPRLLVVSSPSKETGDWHNSIHAWAWDMDGYRALLEDCGWRVLYHTDCDGGWNCFDGVEGPQRFQAAICAQGRLA
jgi:trans-aconitate methyltransferase